MKIKQYDWDFLKNQFVQSNLSVLAFCKKNKIDRSNAVLRHIKRDKWENARLQFRNKVTTEIEKKAVRNWAKTWVTLEDTWDMLLKHARASLRPIVDKEGKAKPLGVESQAKVANVLDHVTKNLRLLAGESTENVESTDPKLEGIKDDVHAINRELISAITESKKLQSCIKTKTGK